MTDADPQLMQHPDGSYAKSKVLQCESIGCSRIQAYINMFYVTTRNSVKRSQVGPNSVSFARISNTKIKQSEALHFKIDAATSTNPAKLKKAVKKDGGKQKQPLIALIEETVSHFRRLPRGLEQAYKRRNSSDVDGLVNLLVSVRKLYFSRHQQARDDIEREILREGFVEAKTSVEERTTELDRPFYSFRLANVNSEDFDSAIELL